MGIGTVLTLDFSFTGPGVEDLPQLVRKDFMESPGSLLLLEARHPAEPLPAGVPAHGRYFENVLADNAAKMLGTDTKVLVQSVYASASEGKVERSAKGGIHAIQSTTQTGTNKGFSLRLPDALIAYLQANPNHDYYVSQWGATTKAATGTIHAVAGLTAQGVNSYAFALGSSLGTGPARRQGRTVWPETAGKPYFRNVGNGGFHEEFHTGTGNGAIFEVGNFLIPNVGASRVGTHGAQIFYRGYIEDLTVSGRTYAQVDALDFAEYTKQVLTPGGRYYGDTVPTDPATIT